MVRRCAFILFVAGVAMSPQSWSQTTEFELTGLPKRVALLENEVAELRRELAGLRQLLNSGAPQWRCAPEPPQSSPSGIPASTTVSGLVDAYYGYSFNQPNDRIAGLRAFDGPIKRLALNLAELSFDKPTVPAKSRLGYRFAIAFGQAIDVVNSNNSGRPNFGHYLKEGYISYLARVGRGLHVDIGKFVTPHGAEVIQTTDNANYSRGLLFTYAIPYYHLGVRAKYAFGEKYVLTGLVVNGWNNAADAGWGRTVGASFAWNAARSVSITQNYMFGREISSGKLHMRQLSDTVVSYTPIEKLTLSWNFDYGRGDRMPGLAPPVYWTGIAQYISYSLNARNVVAARYEYYNDHYGFTTGTAQHIHEFTATLQRLLASRFVTRVEFRRDMSNRPVFTAKGMPVNDQNTVTAGMLYSFQTRETK